MASKMAGRYGQYQGKVYHPHGHAPHGQPADLELLPVAARAAIDCVWGVIVQAGQQEPCQMCSIGHGRHSAGKHKARGACPWFATFHRRGLSACAQRGHCALLELEILNAGELSNTRHGAVKRSWNRAAQNVCVGRTLPPGDVAPEHRALTHLPPCTPARISPSNWVRCPGPPPPSHANCLPLLMALASAGGHGGAGVPPGPLGRQPLGAGCSGRGGGAAWLCGSQLGATGWAGELSRLADSVSSGWRGLVALVQACAC